MPTLKQNQAGDPAIEAIKSQVYEFKADIHNFEAEETKQE